MFFTSSLTLQLVHPPPKRLQYLIWVACGYINSLFLLFLPLLCPFLILHVFVSAICSSADLSVVKSFGQEIVGANSAFLCDFRYWRIRFQTREGREGRLVPLAGQSMGHTGIQQLPLPRLSAVCRPDVRMYEGAVLPLVY